MTVSSGDNAIGRALYGGHTYGEQLLSVCIFHSMFGGSTYNRQTLSEMCRPTFDGLRRVTYLYNQYFKIMNMARFI